MPSIRKRGLLSAERLTSLVIADSGKRKTFLRRHRNGSQSLEGGILIRDQRPMPPHLLAPALRDGLTPEDWYEFLNNFVFLWASEERLNRHLRAFEGRAQAVLILDAKRMIEEISNQLYLCPINSGNARRKPISRSLRSFVPYPEWVESGWPEIDGYARPRSHLPAEVTVRDHLPLEHYLVDIWRR